MKKLLLYVITLTALVGCSRNLEPDYPSPVKLRVCIAGGGSPSTKMDVPSTPGAEPGIDALNENLIKTLDIFFYSKTATATTPALYHRFFTPNDPDGDWETSLETDDATLTTIFGNPLVNGAEAQVFAIANTYNTSGTEMVSRFTGTESIQQLRTTKVSADFCKINANLEGIPEECFVMEGTSNVTLSKRTGYYYIEGTIPLYRSAAKIELAVSIPQAVIDDGVEDGNGTVWKPITEQMDVILVNGSNKGIICTVLDDYAYDYPAGDNPISFPSGSDHSVWWTTYGHRLKSNGSFYEQSVPFYSYPTKNWKNNKGNEAYLELLVPWYQEGNNSRVLPTYYQIPIAQNWAEEEYRIKSYRYYRMEVEVSIIGSFTPDNEDKVTLVDNSYIVLDWRLNDVDKVEESTFSNVTMSQVSYLALEENELYLDNVASGGISYASSHPVTAEFTKIEFLSFLDNNLGDNATNSDRIRRVVYERQKNNGEWINRWYRYVYDIEAPNTLITGTGQSVTTGNTGAGDPFSGVVESSTYGGFPLGGYSLSTDNDKVTLTHTIPDSQFTHATITVEVSNEAVPEPLTITFVQRPKIYLDGHRSNGSVWVNSRHGTGNTYAYNDRGTNSRNYCIGTAGSSASGTRSGNNNRNLYSISISSFNDNSYVLGDPRTPSASPVQYLSAPDQYRPTRTSDTENMIAPSFLIASSYGKSAYNDGNVRMTKDLATQRCAAYQEDGYPAGRWRVPTYAEVEFIMSLSTQGKIPSLFTMDRNDNVGYWCANGKVQTNNYIPYLGNDTNYTAVRCVYDLWYWGDEPYQENATTWLGYQD